MKVIEYGAEHSDVILLLHGGGLSWWNFREVAERLSSRFHVVLPILDGHNGSDRPFMSIEQNAEEVIAWVDEHCAGQVLLMGGVSLGGQIVTEILCQRPNLCRYAIIESALVFPMKWTYTLIKPMYDLCYPLIQKRWFARLQFASLHIKKELFEDYFADTQAIAKQDLIAFLEANANYRLKTALSNCMAKTLVVVGNRELPIMKRSAKALADRLPAARLEILKGYSHGELSLNHAEEYVAKCLKLMKE